MNDCEFAESIRTLILRPSAEATATWVRWAGEYAEMNRDYCGDMTEAEMRNDAFLEKLRKRSTVDGALSSIYRAFRTVHTRYDAGIADGIYQQSLIPHCLYPNEILAAGDYLAAGGASSELEGLSIAGSLDGNEEPDDETEEIT